MKQLMKATYLCSKNACLSESVVLGNLFRDGWLVALSVTIISWHKSTVEALSHFFSAGVPCGASSIQCLCVWLDLHTHTHTHTQKH